MGEGTQNPIFRSVVLLVNDVTESKQFYTTVLGQKVIMDFGENVGFEGGFAIWERDYALRLIFREKMQDVKVGTHNAELYFEYDDLDELYQRLLTEEIQMIHSIREQPWGQRVFRIYYPDNHILEFVESMASVVRRLNANGFNLEEIITKSLMPIEFINMVLHKSS